MSVASLKGGTYAVVDVETNGMSATHGQIIEIGIVRIEDGEITDTYQSLVRPSRGIPEFITTITGLHNADLDSAPPFEEIAHRVQELLEGAVFVAHNARFDYSFIKNEFKRLGIRWNAKTLCTVKISRRLYPAHKLHNLDAVTKRHGITVANRHRAYDDAYALVEFLRSAEAELTEEPVRAAINHALGNHTLPSAVDPAIIKSLPRAPGVYLFYGSDNDLLYVGKSVDIRTRVLSHFSGDYANDRERMMCEQVAYIEHEETSGELSALLRESVLIKELSPIYNRRLRKIKQLALAESAQNSSGYMVITIAYKEEIETSEFSRIQAVFRSVAQGKAFLKIVAKEYKLCPKLLGIEKGAGACFSYQLGSCYGACIGKESADIYNARFEEAFKERRIRSWPFPGAMVLPEDPEAEEGVAYVIDQWKIQKVISYTAEGYAEEGDTDAAFDYDSYKILSKHLLRPDVRSRLVPYASLPKN